MEHFVLYLAAGALVGFIRGLLGSGGAFYVVPALVFAFTAQNVPEAVLMPLALGTSAACVTLVSLLGARAHSRRGELDTGLVRRLLPGLVAGSLAGPFVVPLLPVALQMSVFGALAAWAATQMLFDVKIDPRRSLPGPPGMLGAGAVIGASSCFTGGGATLAIPFMLWCNVPMRTVVGTSSAISAPLALVGALGYMATGLRAEWLPDLSLGYVYIPAVLGVVAGGAATVPVGTWLSFRLPVPVLKRCVAVLLYVVVARLVARAF